MMGKALTALLLLFFLTCPSSHGKSIGRVDPGRAGSSTINESQQTTGVVTGFANSTAEGNGQPQSAVAYAWQGGQTSAYGSQNATAGSASSDTQTAGASTCQQGYLATAGGKNSTFANSVGNALCNATYSDSGTHNATHQQKGIGKIPQIPNINMNSATGQFGEGISGQYHTSSSNSGGLSGFLNVNAGGLANNPQQGVTIQHSVIGADSKPSLAIQDFLVDQGIDSLEVTDVSTGGGFMNHSSGGLTSIYGVGANYTHGFNSHAIVDEEEDENA